ncbi:DUF305 domain-containing protein [Micromonospora sp. C31]|uniref:DUF305 domain-containing protein n=1 Tax=Micromonospora sp. C31 TaxID=2824876 RepID=UPI001B3859FF|nr:DUF305 domain-containing protein [Micromonospora sp. C31]MBQ1075662.1 DUF305 domain-containing protein [Micromonospora sp. C31]
MRDERNSDGAGRGKGLSPEMKMYLRFGAMILTAMVVMYGVMYLSTWRWSDIRFSESRMFMAFAMGGTMGVVMLGWMRNMYRNTKANLGIVAASVLLLGTGVVLDRSQATVDDSGWMNSMIPHHSMAITRSERANLDDVRVCQLAVEISEAQRREISEMEWLIEDIRRNGVAETPEEAQARPVPEYDASASRQCPAG